MSVLVTNNQIASYQRDGVVLLKNLFDKPWLEILAEGVEENLRNTSKRPTAYVNGPTNKAHFLRRSNSG